jgi:hypothetical protein
MELRASHLAFSLDALIAEAKRRARQRRLLVSVLLLAVAVGVAAVVLGSPGGGSRPGGLSGELGARSAGSQSVRVGVLALTVPHGFYQDKIRCPIRHCRPSHGPTRVLVTNHPLTAASSPIYPAKLVVLDLGYLGDALPRAHRPPLNLHKLHPMPRHALGDGTAWSQVVSGGKWLYQVTVFEGSKAPPADRAAVLRALRSIHRAR